MRRISRSLACALLALLPLAPATADVRFDASVLWSPDPDDDTQIFLHATNMVYPAPRETATVVFAEMADPYDDYPVLAYIAHTSGAGLRAVWDYRQRGYAWFDVMLHFGMGPEMVFVKLPQDPGPPYGRAYGHWRTFGNRMKARHLKDEDVRFWVSMRTTARYADVPVGRAFRWYSKGRTCDMVAGERYRDKKGMKTARYGAPRPGKGKGNEHGNGKGKGHGKH